MPQAELRARRWLKGLKRLKGLKGRFLVVRPAVLCGRGGESRSASGLYGAGAGSASGLYRRGGHDAGGG